MNTSFRKYSGLKFFQDYCIPNSTATKNPLFLKLAKTSPVLARLFGQIPLLTIQDSTSISLEQKLNDRIDACHFLGALHSYGILFGAIIVSERPMLGVYNLVLNGYLLANQIDIRDRLKKVMKHRKKH